MYKSYNILAITLVTIILNNLVSSSILTVIKTDLDSVVSNGNLSVTDVSYSENISCSPHRGPDLFTSKCCGNRYVKEDFRKKRSVGSKEASSTEYPWVALLEYSEKPGCSGILISNIYVLTAAHCVVDMPNRLTSVRLGHHGEAAEVNCTNSKEGRTCYDGAISIPIENITVHSNYSMKQSWNNDIAIIRLKEIVHYSEYIQPICLPTFEVTEKSVPDVLFEFAGWGTTYQTSYHFLGHMFYTNREYGKKLKKVENMAYKSNDACQKLYDTKVNENLIIRDTHICAGGAKGQGPCSGDSGGPLMYKKDNRYIAVGMLSFTTLRPCAYQDVPAVFISIYKYNHWIREHTSDNDNLISEINALDNDTGASHSNITKKTKTGKKLSYNVISNHGTVHISVTRSLIVFLFCLHYSYT